MARIRRNDMVEVIAGNDRGKRGRVLRLLVHKDRLVVEGINLRWKHMRKSQQMPQGGRVRREAPIHRSNVMLYDEAAGGRTRVAFRTEAGRKVRIGRKSGAEIGAAPEPPKKPAKPGKGKAAETAAPAPKRPAKPAAPRKAKGGKE